MYKLSMLPETRSSGDVYGQSSIVAGGLAFRMEEFQGARPSKSLNFQLVQCFGETSAGLRDTLGRPCEQRDRCSDGDQRSSSNGSRGGGAIGASGSGATAAVR
jgi:hypothetical protein